MSSEREERGVALVVGVGPTTGARVCRLLGEHHTVAMVARSRHVIDSLVGELPDAHGFQCDISDRDRWGETLRQIIGEVGVPTKILLNAESAAWGPYNELSLGRFSASFEVNAVGLLQMVQALFPAPETIANGTRMVISSSPAAYDPPARMLGLAPARVAQRVLAELLHESLSPHGLEFSVFSIDGAIDEPRMRAAYPDRPTSFFIQPDDIAASIMDVFQAESFELSTGISGESSFANR